MASSGREGGGMNAPECSTPIKRSHPLSNAADMEISVSAIKRFKVGGHQTGGHQAGGHRTGRRSDKTVAGLEEDSRQERERGNTSQVTDSEDQNRDILTKEVDEVLAILDTADRDKVYDKLLQKINVQNRVELVINEMLEEPQEEAVVVEDEDEENMDQLLLDVENVLVKLKEQQPDDYHDANVVYMMLEGIMDKDNRVEMVLQQLCRPDDKEPINLTAPQDDETDIIREVHEVMLTYPEANADMVFAMLEERSGEADRVTVVRQILSKRFKGQKSTNKLSPRGNSIRNDKIVITISDTNANVSEPVAGCKAGTSTQSMGSNLESARSSRASARSSRASARSSTASAGSSTQSARPCTQSAGPSTQSAGPSTQSAGPSTQSAGPSTQSASPNTQSAGPSTQSAGPSTQSASPSTQSAGPSTQSAGPSTQSAGPSTQSASPSTQSAGPSTQSAGPSIQSPSPSTQSAGPSTQSAGPSIQSPSPSTQSAGPSTQSAGPSTQSEKFRNQDILIVKEADQTDPIQKDVETMKAIFPDSDPNYLFQKLEEMSKMADRVNTLASQMFEHRNYPKLKDRLEQEKIEQRHRQLMNAKLNMEEFVQMLPNPVSHYNDVTKEVSEAYYRHALIYLKNSFPRIRDEYIDSTLSKHNRHLTPAYTQLQKEKPDKGKKKEKKYRQGVRPCAPMPVVPDELFYQEMLFVRHQQEIIDFIENKKNERLRRYEEARERGLLQECACCYDDQVLVEDMASCGEGHLFCKECIRRSAEEIIGQGRVNFSCLTNCQSEFSTNTLQKVLPSKMFSLVLRKIQEEEVKRAGIEDLVSCPFCPFATIMPNPEDKVLKCLNPECLRESCRLCEEPSHIPLRCEEVEKHTETSFRTYIENKMAEAMIRTCWKCKNRFYKIEGCNKMTCTCGASMCYICRQPVKDYRHFEKCQGGQDTLAIHKMEVEKAAREAKAKYLEEHPEARSVNLRFDAESMVKEMPQRREGYRVGYDMEELFGEGYEEDLLPEDMEEEEEDFDAYDMYGMLRANRGYFDWDEDEFEEEEEMFEEEEERFEEEEERFEEEEERFEEDEEGFEEDQVQDQINLEEDEIVPKEEVVIEDGQFDLDF